MHAYLFTVSYGIKGPFCCRFLDVSELFGLKSWQDYEIVLKARERLGVPRNEITPGTIVAMQLRGQLGMANGPYLYKSDIPETVKSIEAALRKAQQINVLEHWLLEHSFTP